MGATPLGITVGLSLPPTTAISWVEDLYQAMATCLENWGEPCWGVISADLP
jgi:thiamine-monophosphate kinase